MKTTRLVSLVGLAVVLIVPSAASVVNAQSPAAETQFSGGMLSEPKSAAQARMSAAGHNPAIAYRCNGRVSQKTDVAFEGVKRTAANWSNPGNGGGETGRFDKTPVLTTRVVLRAGCLNAHLSAMVGSRRTYGPAISAITMFQVTLTPPGAANHRHMIGHFDRPYGIYGPAVALEAENDVDMYASNFFQPIGAGPTNVPPGVYTVDVWWAGGPIGNGGAIGAAFVLSLYQM